MSQLAALAFSAALCRGLIEADAVNEWGATGPNSFPRLYAAASLKHTVDAQGDFTSASVFRGFMPRPH